LRDSSKQKLAGLYLVADLTLPEEKLLKAVQGAIKGGVQIMQIWRATMGDSEIALKISEQLRSTTSAAGIPLIVNNDVELARKIGADGVHFDDLSIRAESARNVLGANAIVGYTCGNDQAAVREAEKMGADYVSFCAVFPSPSVVECEIVPLEVIRQAKRNVSISVFASGGIAIDNAHLVMEAGADGLAIASAILMADDSEASAKAFRAVIDKHRKSR
jgi:thiamine-phosphate pyrophosphorylase